MVMFGTKWLWGDQHVGGCDAKKYIPVHDICVGGGAVVNHMTINEDVREEYPCGATRHPL